MNYRREEFISWLESEYGDCFEEEKIHRDLTACILWKGKADVKWGIPKHRGKYICRVVAAHVRGSLSKEESPYRICCNKICINPEHFKITKKGETCWFHEDPDAYFRRKETIKLYAKKISIKAAENLVKDKFGCVAKPSHVRCILRKNNLREKTI